MASVFSRPHCCKPTGATSRDSVPLLACVPDTGLDWPLWDCCPADTVESCRSTSSLVRTQESISPEFSLQAGNSPLLLCVLPVNPNLDVPAATAVPPLPCFLRPKCKLTEVWASSSRGSCVTCVCPLTHSFGML